ncbi:MAG TPA: hypothetical protein VFD82_05000 [Planctomycetota bacterium]|nr:hypothetical protein [Planctomycetota bacterium]
MTTHRHLSLPFDPPRPPSRTGLRRPFAALLLATALLPAPALAQGAWSPHFDVPGLGMGGRVFALGTWRNELIAGTTHPVWRDGTLLSHVGAFDGVRWHALGSGVDSHVRAICEFQGDLYIGGAFTHAGGTAASYVARWNGSVWQPLGAGFDNEVWALCEHQGQLYAAGAFAQSGTTTVNGVARWNGSTWQPLGIGLQWQLGMYYCGRALLSDGTDLYIGGDFDRAGGVPASYIARWNGGTWSGVGGGINNFGWASVWRLVKHQGRVYASGSFGQAGTVLSDNVAAWDGSQWHAVGAGVQNPLFGVAANALATFNNELYVGGNFIFSGNTQLARIARFDGQQLLPIGGVGQAEVQPATVIAMTAWNGRLWCGGEFELAGDILGSGPKFGVYHVAAYDGASWSTAGGGLGCNGGVHVLGRWQGQPIAGGRFDIAGGNSVRYLTRFDGDEWQPFGAFDGPVLDCCEHNGELWVAGDFYTINGVVANGVARFDGASWSDVGGGPGPWRASCIASYQGMIHIGTTGSPQRWNGTSWQTFTPPITGMLLDMHVHNGVLYMAGYTPSHPGAPNIFAWNGTTLSVPGGGVNDVVESLGSFGNDLVVGGSFTMAGTTPASGIARWNGSSWSTFGIGLPGGTVSEIATFRAELVIGGTFSVSGAANVARWTGSTWAPLSTAQPNLAVLALLADEARGELLAGGSFTKVGAQDAGYLDAFEVPPFWTDVGAPLASPRRAPRLSGNGRLMTGSRTRWQLSSAQENSLAVLALGFSTLNVPLFGGTLVPSPDALLLLLTDGIGTASYTLPWPGSLPGFQMWTQAWILDPAGPQGMTASNGVRLHAL